MLCVGPPAVAWTVHNIGSFCSSVCPSVCPGVSWNCIISLFWILAWCQKPIWSCAWQSQTFWKKLFCLRIGKWTKNVPKTGFFELTEKSGHWFLLNFCSIIKTGFICCVPAQMHYLGNLLFLRYGPKCWQPIKLQDFFINHISKTNQWNSLIFCVLIQSHVS